MANFMDSILVRKPGWSKFPLTHEVKSSIEFGKITPFFLHETTPGEKLRLTSEVQLKFSPLISPVMHRINLFTNYFYVPYYTIWSAYEDFFGGGREGNVQCEPPYLTPIEIIDRCFDVADLEGYAPETPPTDKEKAIYGYHHSWFDYIGIPLQVIIEQFDEEGNIREDADDVTHLNMLPLLSCWKAYHDYFQDENLDETFEVFEELFSIRKEDWISSASLDSYDDRSLYVLPSRAWEHDYFTSALPWAQRGEQVEVPLAGNATVTIPDQEISLREVGITFRNPTVTYNGGALPSGATHWEILQNDVNNIRMEGGDSNSIQVKIQAFDDNQRSVGGTQWVNVQSIQDLDVTSQITAGLNRALSGTADLTNASAVSINTFRWLERLQAFLEKNARAGFRYVEQLLAHWGVRGDDLRLMRAQYLSGSVQPVQIGEVLQTSETTEDSPQGQYAGYAAAYGNMNGFKRKFKYHGFVVGFMTVMPRTAYFQGIPRMFLRNSKYDYLYPEFSHLGEQPVYEGELYYKLDSDGPNTKNTFGYMPRYSDYRTVPSQIHGDFQDTMKFWHLGREFGAVPRLNTRFIYADPSKRIFAFEKDDYAHIWCQVLNKCSAWLPLPKYGTPTL